MGGSSAGTGGSAGVGGGGSGGTSGENSNDACKDGVDNDGNNYTDCKDFGCQYYPVTAEVCPQAGEATDAQCSDGIDNDGDKFVDCKDFSCSKNPNITVCGGSAGSGGTGGTGGTGGGPGGVNLRVVNFNTLDLIDNDPGGPSEEVDPNYEEHVDDVASVLALLQPDVVVLQELENFTVLNDLAQRLATKRGVAYPGRWMAYGNDPVRNLALIATIPIGSGNVISHEDDRFDINGNLASSGTTYTFTRNCPEVDLTFQGYPVTLFPVHLKSKFPPDDPQRRLAEARRARRLVDARLSASSGARLLVLGDFNDTPGSPPLLSLTQGFGSPPGQLSSGVSTLPAAQAWTHPFNGGVLIDDQLASPSLAQARVNSSIKVFHDNDAGFPASLNNASDHSPVAITYHLGDAALGP